jgi:hypothetical protein
MLFGPSRSNGIRVCVCVRARTRFRLVGTANVDSSTTGARFPVGVCKCAFLRSIVPQRACKRAVARATLGSLVWAIATGGLPLWLAS